MSLEFPVLEREFLSSEEYLLWTYFEHKVMPKIITKYQIRSLSSHAIVLDLLDLWSDLEFPSCTY